jgi:hypothetical protein
MEFSVPRWNLNSVPSSVQFVKPTDRSTGLQEIKKMQKSVVNK